ncbi:type VII secretion protein EccB [Nocardioides panaciterrulae]|uniref:Type VII secretion protein EccB n=1 Tax=Nocardioides panaciterrulae TaxID=661492 RepID=A0A7Y9JCP9_9ACTN|nr:type VII secretion protein EccB [Nocardioides panaciterrulae]
MATKRDLVEAYHFNRRRLVTAFVSGAPGGREVEPARPGRTLVGGLALAVLLVAGAAVAGVFAPRDPDDWRKPGLVVSKETGAAYVILKESDHPVLRPVINITSARLILQDGATPTIVSQATIDDQTIGDDIGILGAPATLPTSSLLVDSGWTACTRDGGGLSVAVPGEDHVRAVPDAGFVVQSKGVSYVVAQGTGKDGEPGAYRYAVPSGQDAGDPDNMLDELGLGPLGSAAEVPEEWLALFPAGADLDWKSFGLHGFGEPVPHREDPALGLPPQARVGDVVTVGDESLLLTGTRMRELDDFALAVYRHSTTPGGLLQDASGGSRPGRGPVDWELEQLPRLRHEQPIGDATHWPAATLDPELGDECAVLHSSPDAAPRVTLATDPTGDASPDAAGRADRTVSVASGRGAYVLSGDWTGTDGSPFVVDAKGYAYPLEGSEAAARLGYAGHAPAVVPDSWVELLKAGTPLSVAAALCPPGHEGNSACD